MSSFIHVALVLVILLLLLLLLLLLFLLHLKYPSMEDKLYGQPILKKKKSVFFVCV